MKSYYWSNGQLGTSPAALDSDVVASLLCGNGIFTTLCMRGSQPLLLEQHLARLQKQLLQLGAGFAECFSSLRLQAMQALEQLAPIAACWPQARLKLVLILPNKLQTGPTRLPLLATLEAYQPVLLANFKLVSSKYLRDGDNPCYRLKSLSYQPNLLALQQAGAAGGDEALCYNTHGEVCEGSFSNIFWLHGDTLYTPEAGCGLLEGIMRAQVIELAASRQRPLLQGRFNREHLLQASAVFITTSLRGIQPVSSIDDKVFAQPWPQWLLELQSQLSPQSGTF